MSKLDAVLRDISRLQKSEKMMEKFHRIFKGHRTEEEFIKILKQYNILCNDKEIDDFVKDLRLYFGW